MDYKVNTELAFRTLLNSLGMNKGFSANRTGLIETPRRMAAAWDFFTSGYGQDVEEILKEFKDGAEACDEMVLQKGIPFYSMCEHHLLPFFGVAHIGYIPNGSIVGLSKMARLVDVFARRLQVQERLTAEVADAMASVLSPHGVGVVIQARHMCIESRGVQKPGTITTTSALRGSIKEHSAARAEFLAFANANSWDGR